jgi:hypothetical protein
LRCRGYIEIAYKKNQMSTDRESGRGNKRARVTRGSRNPKQYMPLCRGYMPLYLYVTIITSNIIKESIGFQNDKPRKDVT